MLTCDLNSSGMMSVFFSLQRLFYAVRSEQTRRTL